jgi:alpha-methylacyl-CoA racemase
MVLADLGAEVVRVERPPGDAAPGDPMLRGRRRVLADLKDADGRDAVLALAARADVLLEGFRPGVAERLGIGPGDCPPRLVYGRMTGWGQTGPRAADAGHDINYLGLTGVLHAIGRAGERPVPPLNLVADFGGGSMLLVVGVLAALVERERSGRGQVIDAAMVDGVPMLAQLIWGLLDQGRWTDRRGVNVLDGGAPFYDTYACADSQYVAVGAIEPRFQAELRDVLGVGDLGRETLEAAFRTRTRDEWTAVFSGRDACVTPVLSFAEAAVDPHLAARRTLITPGGVRQAAPAPRFSRTPGRPGPAVAAPESVDRVLTDWTSPETST